MCSNASSDLYKTVAIIPARIGSKGIPRKNITILHGKPLIAYTIQAALGATSIDRVIVSTDSEEVVKVAKQYGAEVPFMRPAEISGDRSLLPDVLQHASHFLEENEGIICDPIITLLPTNPLRGSRAIEEALSLYHRENADAINSLHPVGGSAADLCFVHGMNDQHVLDFRFTQSGIDNNKALYTANGAVNIISRQRLAIVVKKEFESLKDRRVRAFVINPLEAVDINTSDDLRKAEAILKYLEKKNMPLSDLSELVAPLTTDV